MKMMDWCLRQGETGKRKHKGLRKMEADVKQSKEHLKKAEHNLEFAQEVKRLGKFDDWIFPVAFYSMYHACLAILVFFGYESRNQECTFTALEYLKTEGKINLSESDISAIRKVRKSAGEESAMKTLREDFQYGCKTRADKELVENVVETASEFVKKVTGLLYVMYGEI